MKGFYPKSNRDICYLLLDNDQTDFIYVLPDGRVGRADSTYFSDVCDINDDSFSEEQLKVKHLAHLPHSFITFITDIEQKLLEIKNIEDKTSLGGTGKVWHIGKAKIEDKTYTLEVHKTSEISSLKKFISDIYDGQLPKLNQKTKTRRILGIASSQDDKIVTYPNLFIYGK